MGHHKTLSTWVLCFSASFHQVTIFILAWNHFAIGSVTLKLVLPPAQFLLLVSECNIQQVKWWLTWTLAAFLQGKVPVPCKATVHSPKSTFGTILGWPLSIMHRNSHIFRANSWNLTCRHSNSCLGAGLSDDTFMIIFEHVLIALLATQNAPNRFGRSAESVRRNDSHAL